MPYEPIIGNSVFVNCTGVKIAYPCIKNIPAKFIGCEAKEVYSSKNVIIADGYDPIVYRDENGFGKLVIPVIANDASRN